MLLMNKTIDSGYRSGEVCIPSSKSIVHRLMICAALGSNTVTLQLEGLSKDIRATSACLAALGAEMQLQNHSAVIKPAVTYRHPETMAVLPAGESGSTLRFLMPVVGALGRECVFKMEGRLANRPLKPFDLELMKHGMLIQQDGDHLYCSGQLQSGTFHLPGNISSQFFSGLLMALPLLPGDSCLVTEGNLESSAYIALTEDALRVAGIKVMWSDDEKCWHIPGGQRGELPEVLNAEGDWSNAAFFLCMGAFSQTGITVSGLNLESHQGDRKILEILQEFGANVTADSDRGAVTVKKGKMNPLHLDVSEIPDLVPVLAVLCCGAQGTSVLYSASRLRLKESDRLHTTTEMIHALGGEIEEYEDSLRIHGNGRLLGGIVDACNDHRIAMSAATAAVLCCSKLEIVGAECVEKSYPAFWLDYNGMTVKKECCP